ncbi:MAG: glycoside hydrolase 5 family protein [Armatimonadota bacterium]
MYPSDLTESGGFVVGANYWASHAGTAMWRDWRPEVVDDDLRRLSEAGLQMLRVFPLWSDFQPIHLLITAGGLPVEVRFGEEPLPEDELGQAGMSAEMMDRFGQFLDMADQHGLRFNIGLLTGWMSGRLHVPPALEGHDVLTDPWAIRWEIRFVRQFVRRFKNHPAVAAWDLGNECNCMGRASRDQAYTWTAQVVNAILAEDTAHPVISGMHGLSPEGAWSVFDQAELTDVLTTHPYPVFTPHCNQDPVNTIRTVLHSTAESRMYSDLGGKPCLCQEIGTLGPVIASEKIAADFIRTCLWSLWANDCHGLIWWCAHEQTELAHAPYDWHAVERELGLLRVDKSCKPVLEVIGEFRRMLDRISSSVRAASSRERNEGLRGASSPQAAADATPVEGGTPSFGNDSSRLEAARTATTGLPPARKEAVCILTQGQDNWGVAYSSYILAKQAGFDLQFQYCTQPIREADLYLLPCLSGHAMISRRRLGELMAKVEAGATLYMSLDSGLPSDFEPITGLEPQTREKRCDFGPIVLQGLGGEPVIPSGGEFKVRFKATRAEALGWEEDGNTAFSVAPYGKGQVYFLSVPMEMMATNTAGAFHHADAPPWWRIYRTISQEVTSGRVARKQHPMLGVTEHPLEDGRMVVIAVNHSPEPVQDTLRLTDGWTLESVLHGDAEGDGAVVEMHLPGNDGLALVLRRS